MAAIKVNMSDIPNASCDLGMRHGAFNSTYFCFSWSSENYSIDHPEFKFYPFLTHHYANGGFGDIF